MSYTSAQIKYMVAMVALCNESGQIRSMEIADYLAVSKPSVHKMIAEFCDMGIITKNPYSFIQITPYGKKIINEYSNGYNKIKNHFHNDLDVNSDTAKNTAMSIICVLSEKELNELCTKL